MFKKLYERLAKPRTDPAVDPVKYWQERSNDTLIFALLMIAIGGITFGIIWICKQLFA